MKWSTSARSAIGLSFIFFITLSCSSGTSDTANSSANLELTSQPPAAETIDNLDVSFASLNELRTEYELLFGPCADYSVREGDIGEAADCDSDTVLIYFDDESDLRLNLYSSYAFNAGIAKATDSPSKTVFVHGSNWMINASTGKRLEIAKEWNGVEVATTDVDAMKELYEEIESRSTTGGMDELVPLCSKDALSPDGISASFNTGPLGAVGSIFAFCALFALQAPDYIFDLIGTTRAIDGRQSETWGDFRAAWTYHPDSGLNLTIVYEG